MMDQQLDDIIQEATDNEGQDYWFTPFGCIRYESETFIVKANCQLYYFEEHQKAALYSHLMDLLDNQPTGFQ
ncbi:hypothetical protein V6R21_08225 [Limibacter armeniacum]|uniref:hypothetical protein n=1 Tax=Limibacter armeniacum TaxID=466084 RepID=UPI002FE4FC67